MYDKAILIAKQKIKGGPQHPTYKKPFVDAAFSSNIFLWDTCFLAPFAKYHQDELPIANALDNFYNLQDADGYICREYTREGKPFWSKTHPVSINPPLLAFAELELYSHNKDVARLKAVYPNLVGFYDYLIKTYRGDDKLFFSDGLGSGMDNIARHPHGWVDDKQGITVSPNGVPGIYVYNDLNSYWNRQGRSVDFSAQMALYALNLIEIATLIGKTKDIKAYKKLHKETAAAINALCWSEADGFYYDLGYGKQIKRKHIGMFWTLIAGVVPEKRLAPLLAHLTNPNSFWRTIPVATSPADQPEFRSTGAYWQGGIWAPTNYMIILGLKKYKQDAVAERLARQFYWAVAEVYKTTGTFWENYAPDHLTPGKPAKPDFCGWTALAPITIYREFITKA